MESHQGLEVMCMGYSSLVYSVLLTLSDGVADHIKYHLWYSKTFVMVTGLAMSVSIHLQGNWMRMQITEIPSKPAGCPQLNQCTVQQVRRRGALGCLEREQKLSKMSRFRNYR